MPRKEKTVKWQQLKSEPCSVARTLSVVGERWTVLIIRDCFRGISRFDAFEASLHIPRAVLTELLKRLVETGILEKRKSQDHARRYDYVLTKKGWDLRPVLLTMLAWGDTYMADAAPPMLIQHTPCGHLITPELHCPECAEKILPTDVKVFRNKDIA